MSYKYSTGSVRQGDIYFEDDRVGAQTYIDFGQDTITLRPSGTAQLYVEDGKVGIGTTSPDSTLHVAGTTHLSNSAGTEVLRIAKADGDTREIVFENEGVDVASIFINAAESFRFKCEKNNGDIVFQLRNNNETANFLFLDGGALRAGINTTTPTEILDIAGDAIRLRTPQTPLSSVGVDGDTQGMIAWDVNYIYICTGNWDGVANIWKRVGIDTW